MTDLPAHAPPYEAEAEPYWSAAAEGRLVLPGCDTCGALVWYPRSWCPRCEGTSVTWRQLSGRGTVYACTVVRRAAGPWGEATPYSVAYVELEEGPRVLTNVLATDPTTVGIGMAVEAVFAPVEDTPPDAPAQAILRFRPVR